MVEWDIHLAITKMIDIIDNWLPEEVFYKLFTDMKHAEFPWYLGRVVGEYGDEQDYSYGAAEKGNMQLSHVFYRHHQMKQYSPIIMPTLFHLQPCATIRIKANLSLATDRIEVGGMHIDVEDGLDREYLKTSILYMNTNNGYTTFEDGTKVESVQNRFVTFPNSMKHAGTTCTDSPFRMVINFNYV